MAIVQLPQELLTTVKEFVAVGYTPITPIRSGIAVEERAVRRLRSVVGSCSLE